MNYTILFLFDLVLEQLTFYIKDSNIYYYIIKGEKLILKDSRKLDASLEEELKKYINNFYPEIKEYTYKISDDGETLELIFNYEFSDSKQTLRDINVFEDMLNIKFIGINSVNGVTTFINKFNK